MKYLITFLLLTFSMISYSQHCDVYIPNAFTPNEDGVNDLWRPSINCDDLVEYSCKIVNSHGEVLWETDDIYEYWNGESLNNISRVFSKDYYTEAGVYVYVVIIKKVFGSVEYEGIIHVIR